MPHVLNPKCGYIISCNNKITDDNYEHYLGNSFMNGYRANRIKQRFDAIEKIDIQIYTELQLDVESLPGKRLKEGLIKGFRTAKPKAQKLIDILANWDCILEKDYYVPKYRCVN